MKTLKYLMLLLAVAVALPAMAQEMEKATMEKESGKVKIGDFDKGKVANVTTGRLNKASYTVEVVDGSLYATVTMDQGMVLTLVKNANGRVEKTCEGEGKKGACPYGFTYVETQAPALEPIDWGPALK